MKRIFAATKKDNSTLELRIYDEIGKGLFTVGITAGDVATKIEQAGDFERIHLRINSGGGSPFEGVTIYNLLRSQQKPIHVFVDGVAASAASVVAMSGDRISMGEGSMMVVHQAWGIQTGNSATMRKFADALDVVSGSMADIYVARTGLSSEKVKAIMDAETWLKAQEAIDAKFADDVFKREKWEIEKSDRLAASFDFSAFANTPEPFRHDDLAARVLQLDHQITKQMAASLKR